MKFFTLEYIKEHELYRLTFHMTGEIREAKTEEPLLRSLVKDYGFYLRRTK